MRHLLSPLLMPLLVQLAKHMILPGLISRRAVVPLRSGVRRAYAAHMREQLGRRRDQVVGANPGNGAYIPSIGKLKSSRKREEEEAHHSCHTLPYTTGAISRKGMTMSGRGW